MASTIDERIKTTISIIRCPVKATAKVSLKTHGIIQTWKPCKTRDSGSPSNPIQAAENVGHATAEIVRVK